MIPKLLHRIWVGDRPIPPRYEAFWDGWAELHPDWEMRTWTEDSLGWLTNAGCFALAPEPQGKADIARYELLARFGGIYLDCDVEPLRALDELTGLFAFAAWEDERFLCNAVMGSEPGHAAVLALVGRLPASAAAHVGEPPQVRTGPVFLTETWAGRDDVTRLERETFYPYAWDAPDPGPPYPGFGVHRWAGGS